MKVPGYVWQQDAYSVLIYKTDQELKTHNGKHQDQLSFGKELRLIVECTLRSFC